MYNAVKDSGQREDFTTGSRRDSRDGKGRYDLMSPIVNQRDAQHLENGAKKYGDRNWEKGQPLGRYLDSAKRHLDKYHEGHRDEDHLAAARWNIAAMIHTEEMIKRGMLPPELDDLPTYVTFPAGPVTKEPALPEGVQFYRGYYIVPATAPADGDFLILNTPVDSKTSQWLSSDGYWRSSHASVGYGYIDTIREARNIIDEAIENGKVPS